MGSEQKEEEDMQRRAQDHTKLCVNHLNVPPARLAGDNALDVFQKHREKELKERQKLYW